MSITPSQIDELLTVRSENEHLEFKAAENRYDFEELVDYCVALANEGGGRIILGVTDRVPRRVVGTKAFQIAQMPVGMLSNFLQGLCKSLGSLDEWLKFSRWQRDMSEQGFGGVVDEVLSGLYDPEEAKSVVAARFFRLVFDHFANEDRLLGEFDLDAHEQARERFRKLDEWEVRVAATQIRQYQLGRDDRPRSGWFVEATSELGILQREIQKKRRQLPLRKLFAEIPRVLQRLKPCVMMSPLRSTSDVANIPRWRRCSTPASPNHYS